MFEQSRALPAETVTQARVTATAGPASVFQDSAETIAARVILSTLFLMLYISASFALAKR